MALLLKAVELYQHVVHDLEDSRTNHLPLVKSPIPLISLQVAYVLFVKVIGPKWMEKRNPFVIEHLLILYNLAQIGINSYVTILGLPFLLKASPWCTPVATTSKPEDTLLISLIYLFFLDKLFEFTETVFFVLRKKFNQVSVLHVYHHLFITITCYIGVKYYPGGHSVFILVINAFVHVIMYTYYLLSVFSKEIKSSKIIKRSITQLQLTQFTVFTVLYTFPVITPNCNYAKNISLFFLLQNFILMVLFGNFYYRNYIQKRLKKAD